MTCPRKRQGSPWAGDAGGREARHGPGLSGQGQAEFWPTLGRVSECLGRQAPPPGPKKGLSAPGCLGQVPRHLWLERVGGLGVGRTMNIQPGQGGRGILPRRTRPRRGPGAGRPAATTASPSADATTPGLRSAVQHDEVKRLWRTCPLPGRGEAHTHSTKLGGGQFCGDSEINQCMLNAQDECRAKGTAAANEHRQSKKGQGIERDCLVAQSHKQAIGQPSRCEGGKCTRNWLVHSATT